MLYSNCMGRTLIVIGIALVIIGLIVTYTPLKLGRLPGDIRWEEKTADSIFQSSPAFC